MAPVLVVVLILVAAPIVAICAYFVGLREMWLARRVAATGGATALVMGIAVLLLNNVVQVPRSITPTVTVTPSVTSSRTATVTVTKGPVSVPTSITVHVQNDGDAGPDGPSWLNSLGGFLLGAGAIATVVASLRRRNEKPDNEPNC